MLRGSRRLPKKRVVSAIVLGSESFTRKKERMDIVKARGDMMRYALFSGGPSLRIRLVFCGARVAKGFLVANA